MEKMTVAQALNELKLLQKRIDSAKLSPLALVKPNEVPTGYSTVDQFIQEQSKAYQSTVDLIKRRNIIKSRIMLSNSTTKVSMGGSELTVAELIESKNTNDLYKKLLSALLSAKKDMDSKETKSKSQLEADFVKMAEIMLGKDPQSKGKDYTDLRDQYIKTHGMRIIDPLKITEEIKKLTELTETFDRDVDFVLNKSNIITEIEL